MMERYCVCCGYLRIPAATAQEAADKAFDMLLQPGTNYAYVFDKTATLGQYRYTCFVREASGRIVGTQYWSRSDFSQE